MKCVTLGAIGVTVQADSEHRFGTESGGLAGEHGGAGDDPLAFSTRVAESIRGETRMALTEGFRIVIVNAQHPTSDIQRPRKRVANGACLHGPCSGTWELGVEKAVGVETMEPNSQFLLALGSRGVPRESRRSRSAG